MITVGSLFSGIGGLELGLERAGMVVRWQVEKDPYCLQVLAKHWPNVRRYRDVCSVGEELEPVDLICGGFPCQDVSVAGKRKGLEGARSGLWFEFARIVRLLRPRYVLVENVPGLLSSGFGRVFGDLAESGYDAEWDCIPAAAFGAPHLRYRLFVVAYPQGYLWGTSMDDGPESLDGSRKVMADTLCGRRDRQPGDKRQESAKRGRTRQSDQILNPKIFSLWTGLCETESEGERRRRPCNTGWWSTEPDVGRVAHGVPSRVDRLRSLGNAVVPQVAEWIGRRIV